MSLERSCTAVKKASREFRVATDCTFMKCGEHKIYISAVMPFRMRDWCRDPSQSGQIDRAQQGDRLPSAPSQSQSLVGKALETDVPWKFSAQIRSSTTKHGCKAVSDHRRGWLQQLFCVNTVLKATLVLSVRSR